MENSKILKTQILEEIEIPGAGTETLRENVLLNFQTWANSYLKTTQDETTYIVNYLEDIYGEVLELMEKGIYILNINDFWCGVKHYYTITIHDGNSFNPDTETKVEHMNKLANNNLSFGCYLTDGDLLEPHITQINDNMIQLTFFIC